MNTSNMASNPMYILSNFPILEGKQLQEKSYLSITRGAQSLTAF